MTRPSLRVRLFAARLRLGQMLRAIDSGDVLSVAALGCLFAGVAMLSLPAAFIVTGSLLALLTPVGAAVRILLRGR
jgi:hypothetical protein